MAALTSPDELFTKLSNIFTNAYKDSSRRKDKLFKILGKYRHLAHLGTDNHLTDLKARRGTYLTIKSFAMMTDIRKKAKDKMPKNTKTSLRQAHYVLSSI